MIAPLVLAAAVMAGPLPVHAPLPVPRPDVPGSTTGRQQPRHASACRDELAALGAKFTVLAPIADPSGCAIGEPVEVTAVGDVAVEPPALLDCATAVAAGGFFVGAMQEVALRRLSEKVTAVRQDSAYVCRTRNGATRLSEHAFGRALDIASFRTASRRVIAVAAEPAGKDGDKAFLEDLRAAACGPFATVLGPGSDPDHAGHFHFDTASRKHGPFCQ